MWWWRPRNRPYCCRSVSVCVLSLCSLSHRYSHCRLCYSHSYCHCHHFNFCQHHLHLHHHYYYNCYYVLQVLAAVLPNMSAVTWFTQSAVTSSFTQRAPSCWPNVFVTNDVLALSATPGALMTYFIRVVHSVALSKVTSSEEED